MPQVSIEAFCRSRFPNAAIERQRTNAGKTYYLIRKDCRAEMYLSHGDTKAKAWKNLMTQIKVQDATKKLEQK